jgi:hypothetical protein
MPSSNPASPEEIPRDREPNWLLKFTAMLRFCLLLLLTATPLPAQTSAAQKHRPTSPATDDKWLDQVDALQNRARQIFKTEMSRQLDPACDPNKLSNAAFGNCFADDEAITERNYKTFARALTTSLAIEPPDVDPNIFPPSSRHFAAGEIAWRSYVDKTCAALGDTYEGGTVAPTAMKGCQQDLTRQHMKDLSEIFLKR